MGGVNLHRRNKRFRFVVTKSMIIGGDIINFSPPVGGEPNAYLLC
jgi:hypothetical protein